MSTPEMHDDPDFKHPYPKGELPADCRRPRLSITARLLYATTAILLSAVILLALCAPPIGGAV